MSYQPSTSALLFPGQGSQQVGMGAELAAASPAARAVFEQADELLGYAISQRCWHGPEEQLMATANAQPALLVTCAATLAALAERTGCGDWSTGHAAVAGHSLGEYTALLAAGALDFATALALVRRRGALMAAASEGGMAAVLGLDEATLEAICQQVARPDAPLVIANYNAPGQLVLSGATVALEQALQLARTHGARRTIPLKVSAAFHSPLMAPAAQALAPAIAAASIEDNVAVQQTSRNARRLVVEDLRARLDLSHIGVGDGTEATRLAGVLGALFGDVQVTSASG